jgi:hypothetical protein
MRYVRHGRQGGAATLEFYVAAFLVLIPLVMAVLQMGMFMIAKNTVNVAALSAARAGAASGGDASEMRRAYAAGLAPLYAGTGLSAIGGTLGDVNGGTDYAKVMTAAYGSAFADIALTLSSVRIMNPLRAAFDDFGVQRNGQKIIPVTGLETNNPIGGRSQQRRSDALLLKVQARHCYRMVMPFIDKAIIEVLRNMNLNAQDQLCYANNGVPINSQAVVRMTVPPIAANFPVR